MTTRHISGLDSIRFVCALWVFFGHGHAPPISNPFEVDSLFYWVFRATYGNMWSGPAAVIVFFVVSGFCIHFPYAERAKSLPAFGFLARRYVRLAIPMLFAIPIAQMHGQSLALFDKTILWSLLAELIYYTLYPFLRLLWQRQNSWVPIIVVSFVLAGLVASTNRTAGDYPSYGASLNWLLGLPCWLMGCLLADRIYSSSAGKVTWQSIYIWRLAVFAAAMLCSVLRFHSPMGYPWTLDFFGVLVLLWLYREIGYRQNAPVVQILEWAGTWSFSLYLLHAAAVIRFEILFPTVGHGLWAWVLKVMFVLAFCYLFYLLVEKPGHAASRALGKRLERVSIS